MKKLVLYVSFCLSLAGLSFAQNLSALLPADAMLVMGVEDLASHAEKLEPFIEEFNRLELGAALTAAFASEEDTDTGADLDSRFTELTALDVIGQEAWIVVSASRFNPLPALTLMTSLSDTAQASVAEVFEDELAKADAEALTEGDYSFYQILVDDPDLPVQVLAVAQEGSLLMLSTNPDTLRGVLRQLGGSNDPAFASSQGFQQTLAQLGGGNFYGYLDFSQIVSAISPYASGFGFDELVTRLSQAFDTAGVSAGVGRVTADGFESESLQAVNADGGDASLYALLTDATAVDMSVSALAPEGALSFSSSATNLSAWWDYLNEVSASTPELGGDLDTLLLTFLGLDLRSTLFNWTGDQVTTITTGLGEVAEPGIASTNLLGETVYIIESTDASASEAGLGELFDTASSVIASFADPSGGMGSADKMTDTIAETEVYSYNITDGVALSYAQKGDSAYIATSADAMSKTLIVSGNPLTGDMQALLAQVPEGVSSFSIADNRASLAGTAQQVGAQLEMMAGLGGASNLNFEAVEAASDKLEQFLAFVAEKLGYSVGYSQRSPESIYGYGTTAVSW